jgi:uncharacterized Ntn-hydrolase superfamily protein
VLWLLLTYSIAATDQSTRQVGGAGTTCAQGFFSVYDIFGAAPGHGVVHVQGLIFSRGRTTSVELLGMDVAPTDILAQVATQSFDSSWRYKQYGIVDLEGRAAGFSGDYLEDFAADRQSSAGPYTYSVQGNILTGVAVLDQAAASMTLQGCDLADRLMLALESGAANGQGDSRCTPMGYPSDSAFIEVDREGEPAGSYLQLVVDQNPPADAIGPLRSMYDAWRRDHACPPGSTPDAGIPPGSIADAGATPDAPTVDAAGGDNHGAMAPPADGCAVGHSPSDTQPIVILMVFIYHQRRWRMSRKPSRSGSPSTSGRTLPKTL